MAKLLVVCSELELPRVVESLNRAARMDQRDEIEVWEWRDGCELVDKDESSVFWSEVPPNIHIIATKAVAKLPVEILDSNGCFVHVVSREGYFSEKPGRLERFLETLSLCWTNQAREAYESYDHRSPEFGVEQWLEQFKAIGSPELGKLLLRHLYVMPTDECVAVLSQSFNAVGGVLSDHIATLSRMGKSGAALSGGLRRRLQSDPVVLSDAIEGAASGEEKSTIHVFEDGLWTGIELSRVLESLLGTAKKPKLPALSDPKLLKQFNIILHFSLATDIGIYAAQSLLNGLDLNNIKLAVSDSRIIEILSEDARSRFESGEFTFKDVQDFSPKIMVVPNIIRNLRNEINEPAVQRVSEIMRKVGGQLWAINSKLEPNQQLPANVEFGANGIGATTLFRHSSPRAVLPVLWASGPIKWGKRSLSWKALFPENGPNDHLSTNSAVHA